MKDEKLVIDGLKMVLKGLGEEDPHGRAPSPGGSPITDGRKTLKKTFVVLLVMMIVPMGLFLVTLRKQNEELLRQQTESAQRFTDAVLAGMRVSLVQGEMDEIQYQFHLYRQIHGVKSLQLIDQAGYIKRSMDSRDIGKRADGMAIENALTGERSFSFGYDKERHRNTIEISVPLANEKDCYSCHGSSVKHLGVLRVVLDARMKAGQ